MNKTPKLNNFSRISSTTAIILALQLSVIGTSQAARSELVLQPGHPSLNEFLLPDIPATPKDNQLTEERISLGKKLFFDPRLSGEETSSCATCHNPSLGWSDGLATGKGFKGVVLGRATPTIINTAFNSIQMWDGRKKSLEDQATGPMEAGVEMHSDFEKVFKMLNSIPGYKSAFDKAYPGEGINKITLSKAIASFERTVISNNSPFDRWVKGDANAMNGQEVNGMKIFFDKERGNCESCHSSGNFTDNGFHDIGLASSVGQNADPGRYEIKPIGVLDGAFKTPTLRDIAMTAPYFHDGSAKTLEDAVKHYVDGPAKRSTPSPGFKRALLTDKEQQELVAFMRALTSKQMVVSLPLLPQ